MNGLELSKDFFNTYGKELMETQFSHVHYASGAVGQGSEFFGFDDQLSEDHDFSAGFCVWLTKEDEEKYGYDISRAYSKLPKEFRGISQAVQSEYAGKKYGVFEIGDFYTNIIGIREPETVRDWFYIPEYALATAVNGEVFFDNCGEFSKIREKLMYGMPKDVKLKKISAHTAYMAQAGQYNFLRCIAHGEQGAAQLSLFEFATHTVSVIFALNESYSPFYKWKFRKMRSLPLFGNFADIIEKLITTPNNGQYVKKKEEDIEFICAEIAKELVRRGFSSSKSDYLENHAISINEKITNQSLKSLHLMEYGE